MRDGCRGKLSDYSNCLTDLTISFPIVSVYIIFSMFLFLYTEIVISQDNEGYSRIIRYIGINYLTWNNTYLDRVVFDAKTL